MAALRTAALNLLHGEESAGTEPKQRLLIGLGQGAAALKVTWQLGWAVDPFSEGMPSFSENS